MLPQFTEENFPKNIELVGEISKLAKKKNCTEGQLVLAWLLKQGDDILPIPGTKKIKYLEENLKALKVELSGEEVEEIRRDVEKCRIVGARYPESFMDACFADTPPL